MLSVYNSKDYAISENFYEAKRLIKRDHSFSDLLTKHILAWDHIWFTADIELDSKTNEQPLVRLHLFHALQCLSKHSINLDYGATARGLHGEAYRGHVFWDEMYILPFFCLHFPDIARSLLMYRYNRLNSARALAKEHGYDGAMFPWQSASNGEEETQKFHLNPHSSTWGPDFSYLQRHVNLAVVYNIWNYFQSTGDTSFLSNYGAEMMLEIAKFIGSLTTYNPHKLKYEIKGIMGPDEYHEYYPNSEPGLDNNTYTNIMAVWCLDRVLDLTNILSKKRQEQLFELLNITPEDLLKWKKITLSMFIPFHGNVLSQFERYEELSEFNWESYKEKYPKVERLDRILKAENKDPNDFQIAKQPDTLMLFYLFNDKEIKRILDKLGYHCAENLIPNTIQYYLKRTSHGSSLSKITCASLLFMKEQKTATQLYREALISDIHDTQGGTTEEGIHLGVMVSTAYFILRDIAGIEVKQGVLAMNPRLPTWINRLKFRIVYKRNLYEIVIYSNECYVTLIENNNPDSCVSIQDELVYLPLDKPFCFFLSNKPLITTEEKEEVSPELSLL
jgi:trehalose/maltose hydrolase-like predicted phosphorylase